eukprot:2766209-Pleurochrysis_carterae.AAC.1
MHASARANARASARAGARASARAGARASARAGARVGMRVRVRVRPRPQLPRAREDGGDVGHGHRRLLDAVCRFAQEGRRIVEQECGPVVCRRAVWRVCLPRDARRRELEREDAPRFVRNCKKRRVDAALVRLGLRLRDEAHERNGLVGAELGGHGPERLLRPPLAKEAIVQLGLAQRGQSLHDGEGAEKGVEHRVRELGDELLGAKQRARHGAREVGQPVHKVKGNVGRSHTVRRQHALELRKERAWRSFRLQARTHRQKSRRHAM